MNDIVTFNDQGLEQRSLSSYAEQAYLDYSMYVILDRALPHIGPKARSAPHCFRDERTGA